MKSEAHRYQRAGYRNLVPYPMSASHSCDEKEWYRGSYGFRLLFETEAFLF